MCAYCRQHNTPYVVMSKIAMKSLMIACVAAAMLGCGAEDSAVRTDAPARPEKWAVPMTCAGVPNLHKVSDRLYRSAQPTAEGMTNLVVLGVKTVVNLRDNHSDSDETRSSFRSSTTRTPCRFSSTASMVPTARARCARCTAYCARAGRWTTR